ncbi:MAG: PstS family phosphate ABC transporter substrate-binding protein [Opitutales bacterium]
MKFARLLAALLALPAFVLLAQAGEALPDYRPETKVTGVIRSWGNPQMAATLHQWQAGFRRYHPGIQFTENLQGTGMAIAGLSEWTADLALMGRQIDTFEYYGVYRRSLLLPVEIEVATGSVDAPGKSPAVAVFVHKDNPLKQVTLEQLDGIFGAQREGGWQGMKWERTVARGPAKNLRTWGQLGLNGAWAHQPIHLYGPPGLYPGGESFFQRQVLGGADTWAEGLMEYADPQAMLEALSHDPYGIAYTGLSYLTPQTKVVAVAATAVGPFLTPTRESVASRAYPLARPVYIYFSPDTPGGERAAPDPKVREFLRYILSRQGQQDVTAAGDYLPLTPDLVQTQRQKLQ